MGVPLPVRFVVGIVVGFVIAAGAWWVFAGYPAPSPSWRPALFVLAATIVVEGIATWFAGAAAGLGASIGAAFGVMPGFIPWARVHTSTMWATQTIIALGGVILVGIVVVVILEAMKTAAGKTTATPRHTAVYDMPELAVRRRKRPEDER